MSGMLRVEVSELSKTNVIVQLPARDVAKWGKHGHMAWELKGDRPYWCSRCQQFLHEPFRGEYTKVLLVDGENTAHAR